MASSKRLKKKPTRTEAKRNEREAGNSSTPTVHSQQGSPLLKLAAELRNNIYELVLIADSPIDTRDKKAAKVPALLSTCKHMRYEAAAIYYGQNTFSGAVGLGDINQKRKSNLSIFSWLRAIGKEHCALIAKIILAWARTPNAGDDALMVVEVMMIQWLDPACVQAKVYAENYYQELRCCGVGLNSIACTARQIDLDNVWGGGLERFQCRWKDAMEDIIKLGTSTGAVAALPVT
ncbi:hypothetical protein LTR36_004403 [Oleoguttula mirabilis]|uniref:Uncharacterized protein n=1 Tax=Oleoguttula mirabilis TaxID=1507867 RepID=A0AAV9JG59_9PEZI|nr:hypothetical protein LTR36_004403 [Oleoguttula mirabilis]